MLIRHALQYADKIVSSLELEVVSALRRPAPQASQKLSNWFKALCAVYVAVEPERKRITQENFLEKPCI